MGGTEIECRNEERGVRDDADGELSINWHFFITFFIADGFEMW